MIRRPVARSVARSPPRPRPSCSSPRRARARRGRRCTIRARSTSPTSSSSPSAARTPRPTGRPTASGWSSSRPARPTPATRSSRCRAARRRAPSSVSTGKGRTTCAYYFYPAGERIALRLDPRRRRRLPAAARHVEGLRLAHRPGLRPLDGEAGRQRPEAADRLARLRRRGDRLPDRRPHRLHLDARRRPRALHDERRRQRTSQRITNDPGYDGGAFFSADCKQIVWRAVASRGGGARRVPRAARRAPGAAEPARASGWPTPTAATRARSRSSASPPSRPTSSRTASASSSRRTTATRRGASSTSGRSTSTAATSSGSPGRGGFDGFPIFSPDGKRLAFGSNRNQGKPGETDVFVARWVETPAAPAAIARRRTRR